MATWGWDLALCLRSNERLKAGLGPWQLSTFRPCVNSITSPRTCLWLALGPRDMILKVRREARDDRSNHGGTE